MNDPIARWLETWGPEAKRQPSTEAEEIESRVLDKMLELEIKGEERITRGAAMLATQAVMNILRDYTITRRR